MQAPDAMIYPWLCFTVIGTVLMIISIINDVTDLYCDLSLGIGGWNSLTCAEFQAFLSLTLEDLPILILTCYYIVVRNLCADLDPSHDMQKISSSYRELFICGVFSIAASLYRTCRSFYRVCYSNGCCQRCCPQCPSVPEYAKLCPENTCARYYCSVPYGCFVTGQICLTFFGLVLLLFAAFILSIIPGVFGNRMTAIDLTGSGMAIGPTDTRAIVHGNSSAYISVSGRATLAKNGSLSVTEAFQGDMNMTIYCLAYFELQPSKVAFNIARISKQLSNSQSCVCNVDSAPCDRYYYNLRMQIRYRGSNNGNCPLPLKPLQRDYNLHVNCNCKLSDAIQQSS